MAGPPPSARRQHAPDYQQLLKLESVVLAPWPSVKASRLELRLLLWLPHRPRPLGPARWAGLARHSLAPAQLAEPALAEQQSPLPVGRVSLVPAGRAPQSARPLGPEKPLDEPQVLAQPQLRAALPERRPLAWWLVLARAGSLLVARPEGARCAPQQVRVQPQVRSRVQPRLPAAELELPPQALQLAQKMVQEPWPLVVQPVLERYALKLVWGPPLALEPVQEEPEQPPRAASR